MKRNVIGKLYVVLALVLFTGIATGCENNDGPAERFGESVDRAVEDVQDAADDANDNLKDAADELEDTH